MHRFIGAVSLIALAAAGSAVAKEIPETQDEVARPDGSKLPGDPKLALVKIAEGFADPVNVASAGDGSGRIFVVERVGRIQVVDKDGNIQEDPFLDLTNINPLGSDVQTGFVEQGLYSVAFHPNFSENGHFFVHYASLPFNGDGMIVRFTVDPESPDFLTPERTNETAKVIMRIDQPWYNHNGGDIVFGPDGYLYIGSGDGGWEGDPLQAGSDLKTWLGKMLRIDVDVDDEEVAPYRIPGDNPFADAQKEQLMQLFGITEEDFAKIRVGAKPEIWAYGLRNPYKFHFDLESGDLWIADVGQNHWEEIIFQPADSEGGEDYGWPKMAAAFCHPMTGDPAEADCTVTGILPVSMYPHPQAYPGADEKDEGGCSVQGLGVANYAGMEGVYLSGDWCSGRLYGTGWNEEEGKWVIQELMQTGLQFTAGGYDEDGNILAVNANNFYIGEMGAEANPPGALWRIMAEDEVPEDAETAETVE